MFSVGKSLHRQIFLALALVTLLSILFLGFTAYLAQRATIKQQFSTKLESTADLKKFQISSWLTERELDVALLAQNHLTEQQLAILISPTAAQQERTEASSLLRSMLISMQFSRQEYTHVFITDIDGTVLVSADATLLGTNVAERIQIADILTTWKVSSVPQELTVGQSPALGRVCIQNIAYNPDTDTYEMHFGHTIAAPTANNEPPAFVNGVLVMAVAMEMSIYPLLSDWPMGETGTAILSRPDENGTRILNQVRYNPAAPLETWLPHQAEMEASPAQLGAHGKEGTQYAIDHRGNEVMTVYRHIPNVNWGLVLKMDTSEVFAPLRQLVRQVLIIAFSVLLCSLLVSLIITETLVTPIQRLVAATHAVTYGNLDVTVAIDRQDEIGVLARSFSNMVTGIDQYQRQLRAANLENARLVKQLQDWNMQLEAKVAERTHALEGANAQLTILDEMKTEFIYTVSHELRNPVTNLKLQLDLLRRNGDSPRRDRYVEAISKQVVLMGQLVDDMLDLIQLEKMGEQLEFSPLDFNQIVADVLTKYQRQVNTDAVQVSMNCAIHPLFMYGEQLQLRRAVTHLVRNAITFTQLGTISLTTYQDDDKIHFELTDTGMGIAPEDLPHIFQRFYRGTNVSQSTIPGSGLGLSLVREVVKLHRGEMEVESRLNQGTTFRVQFPALETAGTYALLVG